MAALGESEKYNIVDRDLLDPLNNLCMSPDRYTQEHATEAVAELLTLPSVQVCIFFLDHSAIAIRQNCIFSKYLLIRHHFVTNYYFWQKSKFLTNLKNNIFDICSKKEFIQSLCHFCDFRHFFAFCHFLSILTFSKFLTNSMFGRITILTTHQSPDPIVQHTME